MLTKPQTTGTTLLHPTPPPLCSHLCVVWLTHVCGYRYGHFFIRPDSKFCLRWRLLVACTAMLEICRVLHGRMGGAGSRATFESLFMMTMMDSQCLPPEDAERRRFFGLVRPKRFTPPLWCELEGSMSAAHATAIGQLMSSGIMLVATCDVIVNFFVGVVDENTLILESKSFFVRWIVGVGFALLLHPGWQWAADLLVDVVDWIGTLRFIVLICLWLRHESSIRMRIGHVLRVFVEQHPELFKRRVELFLFEKKEEKLKRGEWKHGGLARARSATNIITARWSEEPVITSPPKLSRRQTHG